jgi:endonuclease YncB( thermonuclease family)
MPRIISVLILFLIVFGASAQDQFVGKVVEVIDGNTLVLIDTDQDRITIKLSGVDCPELTQSLGDKAKIFTSTLTLNKNVTVELLGKDRWGNDLAKITTLENQDVSETLLQAGLAWYQKAHKGNSMYFDLEAFSKLHKKGIWSESNAIAPWIHRRQQSMLEAKVSY